MCDKTARQIAEIVVHKQNGMIYLEKLRKKHSAPAFCIHPCHLLARYPVLLNLVLYSIEDRVFLLFHMPNQSPSELKNKNRNQRS